jgi:hypothetical protein
LSSTLGNDDDFGIAKLVEHCKKEGTNFDPKFKVKHKASIHVSHNLPPSLFTRFNHPMVTISPPTFKFMSGKTF